MREKVPGTFRKRPLFLLLGHLGHEALDLGLQGGDGEF